jgi:catechol 2,3-dioxygenase-like lactoylglutathione lyase family enzyme
MRGVIHHLDLTVRDPEQVFAFYDAVLSELGHHLERKGDRGFDWKLESAFGRALDRHVSRAALSASSGSKKTTKRHKCQAA